MFHSPRTALPSTCLGFGTYDIMHIVTATKEGSKTRRVPELGWKTRISPPSGFAPALWLASLADTRNARSGGSTFANIGWAVPSKAHRAKTYQHGGTFNGQQVGRAGQRLALLLPLRPTIHHAPLKHSRMREAPSSPISVMDRRALWSKLNLFPLPRGDPFRSATPSKDERR